MTPRPRLERTASPNRRRGLRLHGLEEVVCVVGELEVRVARDAEQRAVSIPGKSIGRKCAMTASSGTRRFPTETKRSKPSGTFAGEALLARLRVGREHPERQREPEMYGERLPGADGERRQNREDLALEVGLQPPELLVGAVLDPCDLDSRGRERRAQLAAPEAGLPPVSSTTLSRIAASAWLGVRPSTERTPRPASSSSRRPATRTMKNSSRCCARIAADALEERGASSSATSRTRVMYSSHESSRFRRRGGAGSVRIATC